MANFLTNRGESVKIELDPKIHHLSITVNHSHITGQTGKEPDEP